MIPNNPNDRIPDDVIDRLWGKLEREFSLAVCSIGTGLDDHEQRCAQVVHLHDDKIDTRKLPDIFEGERVRYTAIKQGITPY